MINIWTTATVWGHGHIVSFKGVARQKVGKQKCKGSFCVRRKKQKLLLWKPPHSGVSPFFLDVLCLSLTCCGLWLPDSALPSCDSSSTQWVCSFDQGLGKQKKPDRVSASSPYVTHLSHCLPQVVKQKRLKKEKEKKIRSEYFTSLYQLDPHNHKLKRLKSRAGLVQVNTFTVHICEGKPKR